MDNSASSPISRLLPPSNHQSAASSTMNPPGPRIARLLSNSSIIAQSLGKATHIGLTQILDRKTSREVDQKRTGIVCTMGPGCANIDTLCEMVEAGMNVCRLNFSHGSHESHGATVALIEKVRKRLPNHTLAILLDTKGPEIRTGFLQDHKPITLTANQSLKITTDYSFVGNSECIACSYKKLPVSVQPGNTILIADGVLTATVVSCHEDHVYVTVNNTATIGERKNMNLPNVKVELPCISANDEKDILEFGVPFGCDFIAPSFVQTAMDVQYVKELLGPKGKHIKIIPKIENVEGLMNFDSILAQADGIMVARGDLGMEIPPEKVFLAQKMMITKCNAAGKPVITATQMLESMTKNPLPTRAETADVANAVLDGSDCVMLSGETASGSFPVESVSVMSKICLEAEACIDYDQLYLAMCRAIPTPVPIPEAVARAAVETAGSTGAALILALTETGATAQLIAKYRPQQIILALSASGSTVRVLKVSRGIITLQVASFQGTDQIIRDALTIAKERGYVLPGQLVVAVHGIKEETSGASNLLKVMVA